MALRALPLLLVSLLLLGPAGCPGERRAPFRSEPRAKAEPLPKVELPRLAAPSPLPAARVLHLFYTANVVSDAEPCG